MDAYNFLNIHKLHAIPLGKLSTFPGRRNPETLMKYHYIQHYPVSDVHDETGIKQCRPIVYTSLYTLYRQFIPAFAAELP